MCVYVEGGVVEGGGEAERRKPSMIPTTQEVFKSSCNLLPST